METKHCMNSVYWGMDPEIMGTMLILHQPELFVKFKPEKLEANQKPVYQVMFFTTFEFKVTKKLAYNQNC